MYCTPYIIPGTFLSTVYVLTHLVFTVAHVIGCFVVLVLQVGKLRLPEVKSLGK